VGLDQFIQSLMSHDIANLLTSCVMASQPFFDLSLI